MKTVLAGYSSTGTVAKLMETLKSRNGAPEFGGICRITAPKRGEVYPDERSASGDLMRAAFAAFFGLSEPIRLEGDGPEEGDRLILCLPVWAGHIPPAVRTFLKKARLRNTAVSAVIVPKENPGKAGAQLESLVARRKGLWLGARIIPAKQVLSKTIPETEFREIFKGL